MKLSPPRILGRLLALGLGLLVTANSALATWSIVVVNTKTREVCVSSATCITNFNLRRWLPVLRVGEGAGAAQSAVDSSSQNRQIIWNGFIDGDTPQEILDLLAQSSSHQTRQYGIVSFDGPPVTFSGTGTSAASFGVTGTVDDLVYAIQGNILTSDTVVLAAESALRNTQGDLATRVMAGMEAARALGGDGRCSCSQADPTGCGAPPPSFTKSAHTAFIVLGRMGDTDGTCGINFGCAHGQYYLRRAFNGGANDIDPVLELQNRVDDWRAALSGVADQVHSQVQAQAQELVADGLSSTFVTLRLRDIDDLPLTAGGATVTVTPVHPGPDPALAGPVTDNGDGTYELELSATANPGRAAFHIRVDDGAGNDVLLWPPLTVTVKDPVDFHLSHGSAVAGEATLLTATLNHPAGAAATGSSYLVLASLAGTSPGTTVSGLSVPLNRDRLFELTLAGAQPPLFEDFFGAFDANGRSRARLFVSPALSTALVGQRMDLLALYDDAQGNPTLSASDHVRFLP